MCKISIIIPHYNSVEKLNCLIKSVPEDLNTEIIVIDDNSSFKDFEKLKVVLSNLGRNNVFLLKNKSDKKGAGVCRNIGLDHARGEWILFADADDYFTEDFYEVVSRYINSTFEVIFFSPTSIYDDTGQPAKRHLEYAQIVHNYVNQPSEINELSLRFKYKVPWSKLISLDFLKKYDIKFEEVIASNDAMFSLKIGYYMSNFHVDDSSIYCVTQTSGSLTKQTNKTIFHCRVDVFIRCSNFLREHLSSEEYDKLNIHGRYYLTKALMFKLNPIEIFKTYIKFKQNGIKMFDFWLLNPITLTKKIIKKFTKYNEERKYYER